MKLNQLTKFSYFFQPLQINTFSDRIHWYIQRRRKKRKNFNLQGALFTPNVNINDFFHLHSTYHDNAKYDDGKSFSNPPTLLNNNLKPPHHSLIHSRWIKKRWNWIIFSTKNKNISFEMHYTLFLALNENIKSKGAAADYWIYVKSMKSGRKSFFYWLCHLCQMSFHCHHHFYYYDCSRDDLWWWWVCCLWKYVIPTQMDFSSSSSFRWHNNTHFAYIKWQRRSKFKWHLSNFHFISFSFKLESLAQEMELERKNRQASEHDVKGPLQERSNYYKNSTLYAT